MLRGSAQHQERVLLSIGSAVVLTIVGVLVLVLTNPFAGRGKGMYSVEILTPYVGQGVQAGTALVLHGVQVGEVTNVASLPDGGVQLDADLQTEPTAGLTDNVSIDYRPINYFGVPGINLVPTPGGAALEDGSRVHLTPSGNFTLTELLDQLGGVSEASLTPQLIGVIDRVTRYTDGLNPLFESMVTIARGIEAVQVHPTEDQLIRLASAVDALPEFSDEVLVAGRRLIDYSYYPGQVRGDAATSAPKMSFPFLTDVETPNLGEISQEEYDEIWDTFLDLAQNGLFGAVGRLVSSHVDDLMPLISGIQAITDTGPVLLRPQDVAEKLWELRTRFERLYAGDGTQPAVSVRILLDSLPGVASSIGIATEGTP